MTNYRNHLIFAIIFLIICITAPVYFIADDWEHLNWYHQGLPPYTLIQLFFRHTGLYISHQIFFPLFAEGYFFLGKIIIYAFLSATMWLICDLYIDDYRKKFNSSIWFCLLPLFMGFAPNQYEWSFWPTNMTCIPSMFLMVLFFWAEKKYKYYILSFVKNITYIFAGFTFESLIPLAVLLELSYIVYKERRGFFDLIKKVLNRTLPFLVIFFIAKYKMNSYAPFPYDAKWGFKFHLFQQWLAIFFSHDYYKARHLTGSLAVVSLLTLVYYRWKSLNKDLLQKEILIVLSLVIGCSYYWLIQDYSSRRAIGGQLYFYWGWLSIYLFTILSSKRVDFKKPLRYSAMALVVLTFSHHSYVFKTKYNEKAAIENNALKARNILKSYQGNQYHFDPHFPREGIGRAWNFIGVRQLNGFLRHYLSDEELAKVKLQDASHKRKVPKPFF